MVYYYHTHLCMNICGQGGEKRSWSGKKGHMGLFKWPFGVCLTNTTGRYFYSSYH